jgi:hypothetical protein
MAKPSDEVAARFEDYGHRFRHEAEKAEKFEAEAKAIKAKIHIEQARVKKGLPESDACPDCWVLHGETNIIIARRADDPSRFDRWASPKCGWYFDIPA